MKLNKGSALYQYVIIIALVALAVAPVYLFFGRNIVTFFEHFYNSLSNKESFQSQQTSKVNNNNYNNNANNTLPANINNTPLSTTTTTTTSNTNTSAPVNMGGQFGGTPDKPVKKCDANLCSLDYGNFILKNIPVDFKEYVESHGTSGGTDKILAILDEFIKQLKQYDPANKNIFHLENLSNEGHKLANIEGILEDYGEDWKNYAISSEEYESFKTYKNMLPSMVSGYQVNFDQIDFLQTNAGGLFDENTMGLVRALSDEIMTLGNNMNTYYDDKNSTGSPQASYQTHLDSAIICATGHGKDTGTQCK